MDLSTLTPIATFAVISQGLLLLAGTGALGWLLFHPRGRSTWTVPSPLAPLPWSWFEFFVAAFVVIAGAVAGAIVANLVVGALPLGKTANSMLLGGGFQFGMLGGALFSQWVVQRTRPPLAIDEPAPMDPPEQTAEAAPMSARAVGTAGLITLLAAFPILFLVNIGWIKFLERFELSLEKQEMVEIFSRDQHPMVILGMAVLAVIIAPVTEELVFRAGLFRFLRTRIPHWAAVALPALLFGTMHDSLVAKLPLVLLGMIFAIAYERTGRITVPIVAHALFNLNTILMLLSGAPI